MNVNPFSYLIEKLKGKVDKSGDTMSGGLKVTAGGLEVCGRVYNSGDDEGIVVKPASNNLAGLILGSNNGKRSVFYCRTAAATAPEWNYVDGNNNSSVIYHPAKSGTIALTSDLANRPITLSKMMAPNENVSFKIPQDELATIVVGHPYAGAWGEYAVIGGYTTSVASISTFHASTAVSSIEKTSNTIVKLTCNAALFVYCTGVGVSIV